MPPIKWESESGHRRKTAPTTPTRESRFQADGYIPTKSEHWYTLRRAEPGWRYGRGASTPDSRSHAPAALSHDRRGCDPGAGFAARVGPCDSRAPAAGRAE